jgi:colicin import membrane protein
MRHTLSFSRALSKALIFALLVWVALQPEPVFAKIYKYKDEHGKTHFTDDASKIPARYRNKDSVKKFRGVNEPTPATGTSSEFPGQKSKGKDVGKSSESKQEDAGLSSQDEALANKTIQVFRVGVALGNKYKNVQPTFPNGQGAVNAIQSALPLKESLASELAGTKAPELKEALGFLKQSIAVDQQTTSVGSGLKTRIVGILNRLGSEGAQQSALIKKLGKALGDSKKKKAAAKKKKAAAEKKKAAAEKKKAAAEKKKAEEAKKEKEK